MINGFLLTKKAEIRGHYYLKTPEFDIFQKVENSKLKI